MRKLNSVLIILCNLLNLNFAIGYKCSSFSNNHNKDPYECEIYANSDIPEPKHFPNKTDNDIEKVLILPDKFEITAQYTHLTQSEYPFCDRFKNLKEVYTSSIKSIDADLLENCKILETVYIVGSDMQSPPADLFSKNLNLNFITITSNPKMTVVPEKMFKNQQNLTKLVLSSNQLKFIPAKVFDPLKNLKKLSLSSNKALEINPRWFKNLENLEEFEHSFNEITSLPKNTFGSLKKLIILDLDGNSFEVIHADSFGPLQNLQELSLSFNRIKAIDERLIDNTGITKLSMGYKNICGEKNVEGKARIKSYFRKCFENYEKEQESISVTPSNVLLENGTLECGTTRVRSNDSPWNVALVHKNTSIGVFCAGTLISNRIVVTAAHCVHGNNRVPFYKSDELYITIEPNSPQESDKVQIDVDFVHVHYQWNPNVSIHNMDIAVLSLVDKVNFNEYIQPICLVEPESSAAMEATGYVTGINSDQTSHIKHQIHNLHACPDSELYNSALCGTFVNKSKDCTIDSGSGLVVMHNNVFYLRGIISDPFENCRFNNKITFTDVLDFYSWIKLSFKTVDAFEVFKYAFKIRIKPFKEKYSILQGANFNLTCEAKAYPHPEVTWLMNDGKFGSNVEQEGNSLKITNAKIENNGAYVCMAKNTVASNQTMTVIDVEPTYSEIPCGMRRGIQGHIVHGTTVKRGEYPWNVALMKKNEKFFCGGTIVSNRTIVTAAHCMKGKYDSYLFSPNDFTVLLGVHNVSKADETGTVSAKVKSIHIHPDWNVNVHIYDADIAVLELEDEIQFNEFIHPICLALPQSAPAYATNGTAVGFGRTETGRTSNIAQKLDLPISNYHTCTRKSSRHRELVGSRSFCGGPAGGRGVCDGDSGSGLYVLHNEKFYLRGIVSASLMTNVNECNVDAYSMFTDAPKFHDWIKGVGTGKLQQTTSSSTVSPIRTSSTISIDSKGNFQELSSTTTRTNIVYTRSGLPIWH